MHYSFSFRLKITSLYLVQANIYIAISFKQNFQSLMNWINKACFAKSGIIQSIPISLDVWPM